MQTKSRTRKWFITINQEAPSFINVLDILKEMSSKCEYSLILHDKDNEEQPHYHLVINYKDAKTFKQVKGHFDGAHIEQVEYITKACRYLLHLDDTDKHLYSIDELITNCNMVEYYITHEEFTRLDTETIIEAIETNQVYNTFTAIKKFGLRQVNLYRNTIKELFLDLQANKNYQEEVNQAFERGYQQGLQEGIADAVNYLNEEETLRNYISMLEQINERLEILLKEYEKNNTLI